MHWEPLLYSPSLWPKKPTPLHPLPKNIPPPPLGTQASHVLIAVHETIDLHCLIEARPEAKWFFCQIQLVISGIGIGATIMAAYVCSYFSVVPVWILAYIVQVNERQGKDWG